jgi:DNA-binding transcriptional ArsR family regulator
VDDHDAEAAGLDRSGPDPVDETQAPDDEEVNNSEYEDMSHVETEQPAPPSDPKAVPGAPKAPGKPRKPAGKRAPKPAPAPRSKTPPPAARTPAAPSSAARSKTPPPKTKPAARDRTPADSVYSRSANTLKLISDPTRLAIVDILRDGEMHVSDLCAKLGNMTQPAVSHHLALLRHSRIIEPRRIGKNNYYSLTEDYGNMVAGIVAQIAAD